MDILWLLRGTYTVCGFDNTAKPVPAIPTSIHRRDARRSGYYTYDHIEFAIGENPCGIDVSRIKRNSKRELKETVKTFSLNYINLK